MGEQQKKPLQAGFRGNGKLRVCVCVEPYDVWAFSFHFCLLVGSQICLFHQLK